MANKIKREKIRRRVRGKVSGDKKRPRLSVFKSNKFTYAQIINDETGETLVSADSRDFLNKKNKLTKIEAAKKTGQLLAERAKKKKIKTVVFDRSGYRYHGRVK